MTSLPHFPPPPPPQDNAKTAVIQLETAKRTVAELVAERERTFRLQQQRKAVRHVQ